MKILSVALCVKTVSLALVLALSLGSTASATPYTGVTAHNSLEASRQCIKTNNKQSKQYAFEQYHEYVKASQFAIRSGKRVNFEDHRNIENKWKTCQRQYRGNSSGNTGLYISGDARVGFSTGR